MSLLSYSTLPSLPQRVLSHSPISWVFWVVLKNCSGLVRVWDRAHFGPIFMPVLIVYKGCASLFLLLQLTHQPLTCNWGCCSSAYNKSPCRFLPDFFPCSLEATYSVAAEEGRKPLWPWRGGRTPTCSSFGCCRANPLLAGPTTWALCISFLIFHMLQHHSLQLHQAPDWKSYVWLRRGHLSNTGAWMWLLWSCSHAAMEQRAPTQALLWVE